MDPWVSAVSLPCCWRASFVVSRKFIKTRVRWMRPVVAADEEVSNTFIVWGQSSPWFCVLLVLGLWWEMSSTLPTEHSLGTWRLRDGDLVVQSSESLLLSSLFPLYQQQLMAWGRRVYKQHLFWKCVQGNFFWNTQTVLGVSPQFPGVVITWLRPELWPKDRISVCVALCKAWDALVYQGWCSGLNPVDKLSTYYVPGSVLHDLHTWT